ncbi:sensor histidine kinase [Flaviaesturariibacter amylovorans]|uniref:Oxygen sensor histidine kinase NreB n=1 Tax=Flaviaesturariibacter amylovorans TaxID=1084520 RepID=A0ABP8HEJ3_9BACT
MGTQETSLLAAIVIAAILIGVIILFFVASIIRQQRRNLTLHRQNMLAEITTLEKERSRMARDLHDELAPLLAAIKMKINSFALTDPDDEEEMTRTNGHIDALLKRIREITFDLMPASLQRKGFVTAAREFVDYIGRSAPIAITLQAEEGLSVTDERIAVNLYRILQEVVQNTLKHAGAARLLLSIHRDKKDLVLASSDDGRGFDWDEKALSANGIGLKSLKSRVEILNGTFSVESRRGKGTSYIFRIPLPS